MRRLAFVLIALLGTSAVAAETTGVEDDPLFVDGTTTSLDAYLWIKRPIVIFADNPNDPRFQQQIALLEKSPEQLALRDVVVLMDSDPTANSVLREKLRPRGFVMMLISKDGTLYLRKPTPWDVREITRSIDKLPLRQQEERDRRAAPIR